MRALTAAVVALAIAAIALLAVTPRAAAVESDLTWREKRAERKLRQLVSPPNRYVDIGVILKVVVADDQGDKLMRRKRRMRVVRQYELGGILDTKEKRLCARTQNPVTWFCSEDQERALFYDGPCSQIIYGSEGAGKSQLLAMLHYVWWLELLGEGLEWGQTAPTRKRLGVVRQTMTDIYPASWFRYNKGEQLLTFVDGSRVRFVSMKIQSRAQGSPAQGWNWQRVAGDELQDQLETSDDLESRGRSAADDPDDPEDADEFYKQAFTCTASEKPAFRALVAQKLKSGDWVKQTLLIANSPFIGRHFLEKKKRVMTEREFRRRYLCEELPPERMLYFNFQRDKNLRAIPPKAKHVTSAILSLRTRDPRHALLGGNDPGVAKQATILLQAFELPGVAEHVWFARWEVFTRHKSTEEHAHEVLGAARSRFGVNRPGRPELLHVRSHPVGLAEHKPGQDVYRIWRRVGVDARPAQFSKRGGSAGLIKREDRIEMINRLLGDAHNIPRLHIECDERGNPLCPLLVEALEGMERDDQGVAENEPKDENDKSDPPCGLGYGLWPFEKESVVAHRLALGSAAAAAGMA